MEIDGQATPNVPIAIDVDYRIELLEKMNSFYRNEKLCDVILIAGENEKR